MTPTCQALRDNAEQDKKKKFKPQTTAYELTLNKKKTLLSLKT